MQGNAGKRRVTKGNARKHMVGKVTQSRQGNGGNEG